MFPNRSRRNANRVSITALWDNINSDILNFSTFLFNFCFEGSRDHFRGIKSSVIYHSFNAVRLSFYIGMVPIYTFGGAKKRVLWFFILVHFHMKASWWVACGKNSRLKHFTLVKINIAFLVTLAMHLFTVSLLKLGHILSCFSRPSEKNDKPCYRSNSTFIENIYNRYLKIGIYSAQSDRNSELWRDKGTIRCAKLRGFNETSYW